jgi:agmatinase
MLKMQFLPKSSSFLGCPETAWDPEQAKAVIIPFGLEASVSYGGGTKNGPAAIIRASQQLEMFDEEFWREPYRDYGVATLKSEKLPIKIPAALKLLEKQVGAVLSANKFPLILGGEHSLTPGAVAAITAKYGPISILHFDAHADLRDGYEGEKFSHASAIRRCLDNPKVEQVVSIGIRSISAGEIPFVEANPKRIKIHFAKDKANWKISEIIKELGARPVYLSFDLDAFDASLMPATGTPEPGGLFWDEALAVIRTVATQKKIVGADIVELAPIKSGHACDFLAAKLCYKILSYTLAK